MQHVRYENGLFHIKDNKRLNTPYTDANASSVVNNYWTLDKPNTSLYAYHLKCLMLDNTHAKSKLSNGNTLLLNGLLVQT